MGEAVRSNCIFTSAGHENCIKEWIPECNRSWDLVTVYYGDDETILEDIRNLSDTVFESKGSKFQNLYSIYINNKEFFDCYDFVWIMDDDIRIRPSAIEEMFDVAKAWDFWACQPSFDPTGKISHKVTENVPGSLIRVVDFIEVTCPLFRKDKLIEFLEQYDGGLVGWGIDFWFSHTLASKEFFKFAVVDSVMALNPHDFIKSGIREIDKLQPSSVRESEANKTLSFLKIPVTPPSNKAFVLLESDICGLKGLVHEKDAELNTLRSRIESLDGAYNISREALLSARLELRESQRQYDDILRSSSWRVTEPIRKIVHFMRSIRRLGQKLNHDQ